MSAVSLSQHVKEEYKGLKRGAKKLGKILATTGPGGRLIQKGAAKLGKMSAERTAGKKAFEASRRAAKAMKGRAAEAKAQRPRPPRRGLFELDRGEAPKPKKRK